MENLIPKLIAVTASSAAIGVVLILIILLKKIFRKSNQQGDILVKTYGTTDVTIQITKDLFDGEKVIVAYVKAQRKLQKTVMQQIGEELNNEYQDMYLVRFYERNWYFSPYASFQKGEVKYNKD